MLSFDYAMELDFEGGEAREHTFTLRCLPQETAAQHVLNLQIQIEPETMLSFGTDGFGTRYCYGMVHKAHSRFQVEISGTAERFSGRHEAASPAACMLYRQPTKRTAGGPALIKILRKFVPAEGNLQNAEQIRDLVYTSMTYVPGATTPQTSAEEAAACGRGVCQDYTHIMLALCRMLGIPCRYTAGLLVGEGASHAWVEIFDGENWIEMDPTNPGSEAEEKLIFSHGRDAADCEINRGVYLGPQAQIQKVNAVLLKR